MGQNSSLSFWVLRGNVPLFPANENALLIVIINCTTGEVVTILSGLAIVSVSKIIELATDSRRKDLFKGLPEKKNLDLNSLYWCWSEYAEYRSGVLSPKLKTLLFFLPECAAAHTKLGVLGAQTVWASPGADATTWVGWFINMPSHHLSHHPQTAKPTVLVYYYENGSISEESAFPGNRIVWRMQRGLTWTHRAMTL